GTALSVIATVTVFTILALWTAAVLNYTDRKRLETERALLRSSQIATAGRMAASIAHEVNNPLEAITNIVYLLRTTDVPAHIRDQYLEAAERELSRVSAIARRTLGFFREDAKESEINIRELVEGVIGVYTTRLPETVSITTSYCERPLILAKSGEIRQVLLNLIVNAIDALPGQFGHIEVSVREQNERLLIEVRDDGVGISPENLESIFEPFFTTKTGHGTGLGLWVSKELVLRNGGNIRVASSAEPQNHGTIFQLSFPPAPARNSASVSVAEKAG
ncbi:MAG TPA: ATP-binding protein, partial [Terriglobales bacterium]